MAVATASASVGLTASAAATATVSTAPTALLWTRCAVSSARGLGTAHLRSGRALTNDRRANAHGLLGRALPIAFPLGLLRSIAILRAVAR